MSFNDLNLDPKLLKAIEATGFTTPTEIQTKAIPVILEGRDLMASAQTGTGKTAAFVLPSVQRLLTGERPKGYGPRVLILTPTRELATQVNDNIHTLCKFTTMRYGTVVGGMPYPPQIKMLRQPLDILVATPGRLIDHIDRQRIDFSRLEILILDEADRMLDMGFVDDVKRIANAAPATRQTLLFSATLEGAVNNIAKQLLKDPARIQLAASKERNLNITQRMHQADDLNHKHKLLQHLMNNSEITQGVIFTSTKRGADQLATKLQEDGHTTAALHGDMNQGARKRTVDRMRRGNFQFLVATDVAARGLDIKGLSHVINFDLPMVAEDYIHRIGRTGRAGALGTAVSLVGPQDWQHLSRIERLTGSKVDRDVIEGLEPKRPAPAPGSAPGGNKRPYKGKGRSGGFNKGGGSAGGNGNSAKRKPNVSFKRKQPRSHGANS